MGQLPADYRVVGVSNNIGFLSRLVAFAVLGLMGAQIGRTDITVAVEISWARARARRDRSRTPRQQR